MVASVYKTEKTLDERKEESGRIRSKFPKRVPVICERHPRSTHIPELQKKKYLVPGDLTIGMFKQYIRKCIKLSPETAIFLYISGGIKPTSHLMSDVYEREKDEDGFLYVVYAGEETFGADQ
ncbi:MAG: hypothetical protein MHM6MM_001885 [Cercozoa sp. M6MM]